MCAAQITVLVNDSLVQPTCTMACVVGGILCATVSGLWAYFGKGGDSETGFFMAFVAFWIGFALLSVVASVVEAGVATLVVCFAEQPEALERSNPEFYALLSHNVMATEEFKV